MIIAKDILEVCRGEDFLVLRDKDYKIFRVDANTLEVLTLKDTDDPTALAIVNGYIVIRKDNKPGVYNSQGVFIRYMEKRGLDMYYKENIYLIFTYADGTNDLVSGLYDFEKDLILPLKFPFRATMFTIYKDLLINIPGIFDDRKTVCAYSLEDGSEQWRFSFTNEYDRPDYNEKGKIKKAYIYKYLGTHEDTLLFMLAGSQVLGLDAATGIVRYCINKPNNLTPENAETYGLDYKEYYAGGLHFYDEDQQLLFGMMSRYYYEVDMSVPKERFDIVDLRADFDHWGLKGGVPDCTWLGDLILFATQYDYFGLFSRSKRAIVWTSDALGQEGITPGIRNLYLTPTKICIHDREKNLHIFDHPFADSPP